MRKKETLCKRHVPCCCRCDVCAFDYRKVAVASSSSSATAAAPAGMGATEKKNAMQSLLQRGRIILIFVPVFVCECARVSNVPSFVYHCTVHTADCTIIIIIIIDNCPECFAPTLYAFAYNLHFTQFMTTWRYGNHTWHIKQHECERPRQLLNNT